MNTKKCGVCNENESKYKCPNCELRYCSLPCFKAHKSTHEAPTSSSASAESAEPKSAQAADLKQSTNGEDPYTALRSHPQFQRLFTKYPNLRSQLQRVHQAAQNPYQPSLDDADAQPRPKIRDRVPGQWTQDKADDLATKILVDLRKRDEGVREFMALVGEVFGGGGGKKESSDANAV